MTGPEALSYDDVARLISEAIGRQVRHVAVLPAQLTAVLEESGLPEEFAAVLAGLDADIAAGRQAAVTDTVRRLTGREPRTLQKHLQEHAHRLL